MTFMFLIVNKLKNCAKIINCINIISLRPGVFAWFKSMANRVMPLIFSGVAETTSSAFRGI